MRFISKFAVGIAIYAISALTIASAATESLLDSTQKVEVYSANVEIYRGGKLVAKPSIVLPAGKQARLEYGNDKDPDNGIRLQLTISDAGLNKKQARQSRIVATVHEKVGGAWVLLSEPEMIAPLQGRTSMEVDSPLGKLELRFLVVTKLVPASAITGPKSCPPSTAEAIVAGSPAPSIRQRCCSAACTNGSGNTLRCCENSISCCDGVCGACCSTD